MKENVKTYIGFCIKKRSAVFGLDSILACRKKIFLILACATTQENTLKKLRGFAQEKQVPLIIPQVALSELTMRENVKVIGLTDENLSSVIKKTLLLERRKYFD